MSYGLRLAVIVLAAFGATNLLTSGLVVWGWTRAPRAIAPDARADLLFALRMLPAVAGVLAALIIGTSFVVFETPSPGEHVGMTLTLLAVIGATQVVWSAGQLARQWIATRRIVAAWRPVPDVTGRSGSAALTRVDIVEMAFPIVALVGVVRPRLIVASHVLEACDADEWRAVLAHEEGHLVRRDNLRRALITAAPDLLSWLPVGARLALDWHDATEEAADDHALVLGARGRVLLAQALLRVARLAPPHASALDLPASAFYRGENIDRRVRELVAPPRPAVTAPLLLWRLGAMAAGLVIVALTVGLVQRAIEDAVEWLP